MARTTVSGVLNGLTSVKHESSGRAAGSARLGAGSDLEPRSTKNDEGRSFPFDALPELAKLLQAQREHTSEVERGTGTIVPTVSHHNGQPISLLPEFRDLPAAGQRRSSGATWREWCIPSCWSESRMTCIAPR